MNTHLAGPHLQIRPANLYSQRLAFRLHSNQALPNFASSIIASAFMKTLSMS
jgi:hypothetical protein